MRAIDADELKTAFPVCDNSKPVLIASVRATINHMPTIEPQRKKGKWINIRHDNIAECDQCGITGRAWMNFCFDCGADMRGETEDNE